ncbi:MAG: pitrilysin family protein [Candidatus Paracaedibacteraceae bacterium]|nr:pitrilysin family protein [Candidatus Paracaedibacteraceae bacterium]
MTIQTTTLPSGLRIVTNTNNSVQTISCGAWFNVGTRHETKDINGIAHMLEHMAFKGTKRRTAVQIAEEIESVGGYLNAYTAREVTAYYARILKDDLPLAVDLLSDILQHSTFDKDEFVREQGVVLQEIGQTNDTPDDVVFDYFQETCYPDQPMGWPTLGTEDVIKALTPKQVSTYMSDHYSLSNMVFSAAGNVSHDAVVALCQRHFDTMPKDRPLIVKPSVYKGGEFRQEKELEQAHIILGFEGVPFSHPDYYAMMVYSTILGGGMSSRLFQEIREKRGLVYTVQSSTSSYRDSGIFQVYAGTGENEVAELIPVMCEELCKMSINVTDEEIKRAKTQIKAGLLMGMESTSNRCERQANQILIYGAPVSPESICAKIDAVAKTDLLNVAATIITKKPTLTALGPIKNLPGLDAISSLLGTKFD